MFVEMSGGPVNYAAKGQPSGLPGLPWTNMGHLGGLNRLSLRGWSFDGLVQFGGNCVVNCNSGGGNLYSFHPGGSNVAMGDGSVRFLKATTAVPTAHKLVVRDDGQLISADEF